MFILMLCAAMLIIIGCPKAAVGRALRLWLVDKPAQALAVLTPSHLVLLMALVTVSTVVIVLFEVEGAILLGMALPEIAIWFTLFDVAAFIDFFAVIGLVAAGGRWRGLSDQAKALARWVGASVSARARRHVCGRQGGRRVRRPGGRPAKDEDEDGAGGWRGVAVAAWA